MTTLRPTSFWPLVVLLIAALACASVAVPTPTNVLPPPFTPTPAIPNTPGGVLSYDELVNDQVSDTAGDVWTFEGAEGDVVTISVLGDRFDARLQVLAPDDRLLVEDDDSGPGANPMIRAFAVPTGGVYQIVVLGQNGATGPYTLGLTLGAAAPGPVDTDGGFLRYDDAVHDQISDGAVDEWVFEGTAGDEVTIVLFSEAFDTELEVIGPDGAVIFRDDDGGPGRSSLIQGLRLTTAGEYTIRASGRGGGGVYTLGLVLSTRARAAGTDGGPIEFGTSVEDVIDDDDGDEWTFTGQAGDIVTIALNGDGLDTVLELYGPEGEFVAGDDDSGPDLNARMENVRLPASGEYTILAMGYQGERGYYALTLERGEPPEPRGALAVGEIISDSLLTTAGAVWTFNSQAGITISIYLKSRHFDPALTLIGPSGGTIASDEDSGPGHNALLQNVTLPEDGSYAIQVITADGFSGDYVLTLVAGAFSFPDDTPGGAITVGQTVTDTVIDTSGDAWTFTGAQGDWVTIALNSDEFDTYLELRGPDGELLAENDDDGPDLSSLIVNFQLPVAGAYTIQARGFGDSGGIYTLTLSEGEEVLPVGELAYGDTVAGELTTAAGDIWTFQGEAGDIIEIGLESPDFDTVVELHLPNGQRLVSDDDGGADTNSLLEEVELPESGVYRILVRSFGGGLGEYELRLERGTGGVAGRNQPWSPRANLPLYMPRR